VVGLIHRDPEGAAGERWDLAVVGGGIYGAFTLLEAARRGLRGVLVEKDDFGGGTSANSLSVIHGGLRYLQSLDLPRFRESVGERRRFLLDYPDLAEPLRCLMPLRGGGLKRPFFFRIALGMNGILSRRRNEGVRADRRLPNGETLGREETARLWPGAAERPLLGGGVWYDGTMISAPRILMETLRRAAALGSAPLNYVEAVEPEIREGRVTGLRAFDRVARREILLRTGRVINCAGPACRRFAARFDRDRPDLFRPSLAVNVLIDRPPLSSAALAAQPPGPGGRVYFLTPRRGMVFAGTLHAPRANAEGPPHPTGDELRELLDDLNRAAPGLEASPEKVVRIFAGYLPVRREGTADLAVRERIVDHGRSGGPRGAFTVSGVKYTTARLVAEKAVRLAFPGAPPPRPAAGPPVRSAADLVDSRKILAGDPALSAGILRALVEEESAVTMEDLLLRRTEWGLSPVQGAVVERRVREVLGWSGRGLNRELSDKQG